MRKISDKSILLNRLRAFFRQRNRMPSYSEIVQIFKLKSKSHALFLMNKWIEAGLVRKDGKGKLLPGKSFYPLKVLGTVTAGFPSPAEEENADTISLDDWLIDDKEASFMLKVTGDSMIDAGVMPGDTVILQRGKIPKHRDIVVAEVDHEWTIKYFYKRGDEIMLVPANKKYSPIKPKEELRVVGVVTAVIRKMPNS